MNQKNPLLEKAAICGLFCNACSLYIGSTEDENRLKMIADRFNESIEFVRCLGCRSERVGSHCKECHFKTCATDKGIDFCSQCETYPCDALKEFQGKAPHRLELWDDLDAAKKMSIEDWTERMTKKYECPECKAINSSYDLVCRKCGHDPASSFVAKNKALIEQHLKK
jgi:ribosomal protein L40E